LHSTTDEAQSWGRGIIADVKRTVGTHWVEEMTNFNQKTVAVSMLMFITVIAPTLTFGAVYGTNTENHIGTVETIMATSWMGVFFSLFGGMPTVRTHVGLSVCWVVRLSKRLALTSNFPFHNVRRSLSDRLDPF
jgi:hypothetical protein